MSTVQVRPVSYSYCQCGCGQLAPIAKKTDRRDGSVKGQPVRFIKGHQSRRRDLRSDFDALVDKNGPTICPELGPCWLWLGYRDKDGYGQIKVNGRTRIATHVDLELEGYYIIPAAFGKLEVLHRCDNTSCVRPSHLRIGTKQDNEDDKVAKVRQIRGEHHGLAKLCQQDVDEIRRLYAAGGITQTTLERQFGVDRSTIGRIVRGETWRHIA